MTKDNSDSSSNRHLPSQEQLIERWTQCLRVLANLSPHEREEHFNMSEYLATTACGTVGCAAGHCSMDPWFHEQGLIPYENSDGSWYLPHNVNLDDFFGRRGSRDIFHNYKHRPIEHVMEEIREHIEWLKA